MKDFAAVVAGLMMLALMIIVPLLFIYGAVRVSEWILPLIAPITGVVFVVDILIILPIALIPRARGFAGNALFVSSYAYGITLWFSGLLITYLVWGFLGVFIGLFFLGLGVVPIGMIASAIEGEWWVVVNLIILTILTFASRAGGMQLAVAKAMNDDVLDI